MFFSLRNELQDLAEDRKGGHMLYDLIEVKDNILSQTNLPLGGDKVSVSPYIPTQTHEED